MKTTFHLRHLSLIILSLSLLGCTKMGSFQLSDPEISELDLASQQIPLDGGSPGSGTSPDAPVVVTIPTTPVSTGPLPAVTLVATPAAVSLGQRSTLSWSSANATFCTTPEGKKGTSGQFQTQPLSADTTITVSCANTDGTAAATVTVTVKPLLQPINDGVVKLRSRLMDFSKMVMLRDYFEGGRYERFHRLKVLEGTSATLSFYAYDWNGEGGRKFLSTQYSLLVDGVAKSQATVSLNDSTGQFVLNLNEINEGWHILDIVGHPTETTPEFPVYVKKSAGAIQTESMPVYLGTHSLNHLTHGVHFIGTVPTRLAPTTIPLAPRSTPAFSEALPRTRIVQTEIQPSRGDDQYRPSVSKFGLLNTMNTQSYFFSDFVGKLPRVPLLDGPRGQASTPMTTHIHLGRNNNIYFSDPWRIGKITPDGYVKTLAGYRHKTVPSYYSEPDVDLIGDWSQIPADRRGFHEVWGIAWDTRTFLLDLAAALINGESPHTAGPRLFVADTQNNRILLLTFSAVSHDIPPVVTEFITGLGDPWDVVYKDGLIYVSERKNHRISSFDATTGQPVKVLLQGPDMSGVSRERFIYLKTGFTREMVQAQNVVGPEGLFIQDDWLYFGSRAMEQVKRLNLKTGALELVAKVRMDENSNYAKISVSDGTFGPKGTVFVVHWSVNSFGYPTAYLPDGRQWDYLAGSGELGKPWVSASYPTSVGVGQGKMVFGNVNDGLKMMSQALPTDVAMNRTRYAAGAKEFTDNGYHLIYGHAGWGYYGLPLPWGKSADMDYYLEAQGHRR